jgi:TolA-binding protein
LFLLGCALEESEQYTLAAETLRAVTVRHPDSPEAETALLKVIGLYVHRLNRREEAKILLRLFLERYPHSQWRALAEDLRHAASEADTGEAGKSASAGE